MPWLDEIPQSSTEDFAPGIKLHRRYDAREIFSWDIGGNVIVYDVTSMKRAIARGTLPYMLATVDLNESTCNFLVEKRGVEMWRVEQLEPEYLSLPAIGLLMHTEKHGWQPTTVDGNHRLVRRWKDGCPYGQVYVLSPEHYEPYGRPDARKEELYAAFPADDE